MASKLREIRGVRVSASAERRIEAAAKKSGLSVGRWSHRVLLHALDEEKAGRRRVCVEIDLATGDTKMIGTSRENE